jgi:hypothetical protein
VLKQNKQQQLPGWAGAFFLLVIIVQIVKPAAQKVLRHLSHALLHSKDEDQRMQYPIENK